MRARTQRNGIRSPVRNRSVTHYQGMNVGMIVFLIALFLLFFGDLVLSFSS